MRRSSMRSNIIPSNRLYSLTYDLTKNANNIGNVSINFSLKIYFIRKKIMEPDEDH